MKLRTQEAATLYADAKADELASSSHCAWCGDPPDSYGSHGICVSHAEQLVAQASARRRSSATRRSPAGSH